MKALSLKQQLIEAMNADWRNGGWVEDFSRAHGFKASNGSRRAREMVNAGIWERKEEKGSVWYRRAEKEKRMTINGISVPIYSTTIKQNAETNQSKLF